MRAAEGTDAAADKDAPSASTQPQKKQTPRYTLALAFAALGVVYGDIGTSPLYAVRECFHGPHAVDPIRSNVLGVLSLIFWSLVLIISIKYLMLVMRADNKGEGGILTLLSLAFPEQARAPRNRLRFIFVSLGLFGAALLYGDGMITPSISVLSAIEGLEVAAEGLKPFVIPLTVAVLVLLFSFQRIGTGNVGKIFGPVTLLWFLSIFAIGLWSIIRNPEVLYSLNPYYGVRFFTENQGRGFVVLGAVFLVVTGGEALYADMGHFGRKPIKWAWFGLVFPALLCNYLGQGALLLRAPQAAANPFFIMTPDWARFPMVGLATAATVIASQAMISGSFSLTMQAIQLGYCPRLNIEHTSSAERGQIYIPHVNWPLMIACIGLVIGFGSSSNLAAAYGIAVTLTMLITTGLFYFASRRLWGWSAWAAALICAPFLILELAYFGANLLKIAHGGWFPLAAGIGIFIMMSTWKTGRRILGQKLQATLFPLETFLAEVKRNKPVRVTGTAIFLSGRPEGTPLALLHNLKHNKVLHQRVVLMTIISVDIPYQNPTERIHIERFDEEFYRVIGYYGFMEEPNVPELLNQCQSHRLEFKLEETTFFLSRETILSTPKPGMAIWREHLFAVMAKNAQSATAFFKIPANRVVELGMQVEI